MSLKKQIAEQEKIQLKLLQEANAKLRAGLGGSKPAPVALSQEQKVLHRRTIETVLGEDGKPRLDLGGIIPTKIGEKERKFRAKGAQLMRICEMAEVIVEFKKTHPEAFVDG